MAMKIGDTIGVQCEVRPGPFEGEKMITFDTVHGPTSGFVRSSELRHQETQWYVRAKIQNIIDDDTLEVRVRGSFFTTNGVASIPRRYAMAA